MGYTYPSKMVILTGKMMIYEWIVGYRSVRHSHMSLSCAVLQPMISIQQTKISLPSEALWKLDIS